MKKIFIFIFLLIGCVETNVIEVKHEEDGFTSEMIAEIQLYNKESEHYFNICDWKKICIEEVYKHEINKYYEIDLNTNEVKVSNIINNINEDENSQNDHLIFDYNFKIYKKSNHINNIYTQTYYYEKNDIRKKLVEHKTNFRDLDQSPFDFSTCADDQNFYFLIKIDNYVSVKQVKDASLIEIAQVLIEENGYELQNINVTKEGIYLQYENEDAIRFVFNDEELILKKNEDGKKLIGYQVEGLQPIRLVYEKDNITILHLKDEIYELGYNAIYEIRDDYILSTAWKENFTDKETLYIDRKTNKTYLLSKTFDIAGSMYSSNLYLSKDLNSKTPYTVYKVNNLDITAIPLPFTGEFELKIMLDDNTMIFEYQENDILQFYKVKV